MMECYYFFLTATKIKQLYNNLLVHQNLFLIALRLIEFVITLLILICLQYNSFLNDTRLKKYVLKLLILVILNFTLFLIDIILKKCPKKLLIIFYQHLNFFSHWFVLNKIIGKVDNALSLMMIYSFLMKILIMPIF